MATLFRRSIHGRSLIIPAANALMKRPMIQRCHAYFMHAVPHAPGHPYESGQLFVHRLHGYKGVALFPWWVPVEDFNVEANARSQTKLGSVEVETLLNSEGKPLLKRYQLHYPVLINGAGFSMEELKRKAAGVASSWAPFSFRGVDIVSHEDIVPIITSQQNPICHGSFDVCFTYDQRFTPQHTPTEEMEIVRSRCYKWLCRSTLYCQTLSDIRISILPICFGWQVKGAEVERLWRYRIRLENLGECALNFCDFFCCIQEDGPSGRIGHGHMMFGRGSFCFETLFDILFDLPFPKGWFRSRLTAVLNGRVFVFTFVEFPVVAGELVRRH